MPHPPTRRLLLAAAALALTACGQPDPPPSEEAAAEDEDTDDALADDAHPDEQRADPVAAPVPEETAAALEAMGYLPTAPTDNPEERGVTRHTPQAAAGVNLYSTRHRASASLIDLDGHVLHEWQVPDADDAPTRWMHVEPLPGGDLLALTLGDSVTRHAWDSSVVWRRSIPAHHDLAVHEDGRIFVLVRWADQFTWRGERLPVLTDGVVILTPDGQQVRRVPLLPLLEPELDRARLGRVLARVRAGETSGLVRGGGLGDLLHTNAIGFLRTAIPNVAPAGSVLISCRNIHRVAILSADLADLLWVYGQGELQGQHDVTQLDNGHLLLFDNGTRRHHSRALEIDATDRSIVWRYEPDDMFSELRGGAQRLANGDTLITESDRGHALEVTPNGELVWEFWNPDVRRRGSGTERGVIYRLNRFPASAFPALRSQARAQGQIAATPGAPSTE